MHPSNSAMILWFHIWQQPNIEVKWISHFGPKRVIETSKPGYPTPKYYNQCKDLNLEFLEKSRILNDPREYWDSAI